VASTKHKPLGEDQYCHWRQYGTFSCDRSPAPRPQTISSDSCSAFSRKERSSWPKTPPAIPYFHRRSLVSRHVLIQLDTRVFSPRQKRIITHRHCPSQCGRGCAQLYNRQEYPAMRRLCKSITSQMYYLRPFSFRISCPRVHKTISLHTQQSSVPRLY